MNIITLDFSALKPEEKRELICNLDSALSETAPDFSFQQKILAQTLFIARSYHFYEQLSEKLSVPIPSLYRDTMEHIWLYLLGAVPKSELIHFYRAIDSVFTYLLTSDNEFFNESAWEKYSGEWNSVCCSIYLTDALAPEHILMQIVNDSVNWHELSENQLMYSIGEYISDASLEPVFKNETGKYKDLMRHETEVYDSPTFAEIFSLLQADFRLVRDLGEPTKDDIAKLREQYRNEKLFQPQHITKIADWLHGIIMK